MGSAGPAHGGWALSQDSRSVPAPGPAGTAVIDGPGCVLGPQLELRAL